MKRTSIAALLLAVTCALACAGTAHASKTQTTMLQDDTLLFSSPDTRDATLDEWKSLGVDTVKLAVSWRALAPAAGDTTKPAVDLTDPASYDQAGFQKVDGVVEGAQARGMNVYIMIRGGAPAWASSKSPSSLPPGVQKPVAADFGQFVQAVGTRYSGNYNGLPRVDIWSIWNEPNLASWLNPQYSGKTPYSPRLYRDLLYAARDGFAASGHADDQLLIGELLPFARGSTGKTKVRPIEFLRELACVDKHYRPYKGSAAKKRGCSDFQPLPGTGVVVPPVHARRRAEGALDRTRTTRRSPSCRGSSARWTRSRKAKRFATTGKLPLALTEFGFQTDPPDPVQSPIKEVPGFMGESEWLAWKNPRVPMYSQYPLQRRRDRHRREPLRRLPVGPELRGRAPQARRLRGVPAAVLRAARVGVEGRGLRRGARGGRGSAGDDPVAHRQEEVRRPAGRDRDARRPGLLRQVVQGRRARRTCEFRFAVRQGRSRGTRAP